MDGDLQKVAFPSDTFVFAWVVSGSSDHICFGAGSSWNVQFTQAWVCLTQSHHEDVATRGGYWWGQCWEGWGELGTGGGFRAISLKDWLLVNRELFSIYSMPSLVLGTGQTGENRGDTITALMVGVRFSGCFMPKEWNFEEDGRESEHCLHELQVGFFSFVLSFNSSSIYYWPFTTHRLCARHWGHSDDQAPFPALVEFKVWEEGGVDIPGQYIWALVEAGLEEEDANLTEKDVEGFLEREDGGVGVHPKGWRRGCGTTGRRRFREEGIEELN